MLFHNGLALQARIVRPRAVRANASNLAVRDGGSSVFCNPLGHERVIVVLTSFYASPPDGQFIIDGIPRAIPRHWQSGRHGCKGSASKRARSRALRDPLTEDADGG